jgi:LPS-assembly protein
MKLKWFICVMVVLLLFTAAHHLVAAEAKLSKEAVTIDAETISYDKETDTFHAKGAVVISYSEGFLMADSASLNRKTEDVYAEGHVIVKSDEDFLDGEKIQFNIATKTGIAYKGNMFLEKDHFYINGTRIIKQGVATYHITEATATTCEGDLPDWKLMGRELNVTVDGYGTLNHGRFLVKDIPILYIPFMFFPVKTSRQSGFLIPQISYSRDKFGTDIEIPFFWAISDHADATFYQRYMAKRGFKEGIEFRYFISKDSFGTMYGDFMNDSGPDSGSQEGMERNWQPNQKRWSVYLNHETTISPSVFFRADIRKVSDRWYFKDFSSNNYYRDHYSANESQRFSKVPFVGDEFLDSLESTVRMVKSWQLYHVTALVSDTDNFASASNDSTLQKYPEIILKGIKQPFLHTPINFEFDAAYDYYYRTEGQRGHLYDIQPVFSLPLNIGDYLQLTPWIGLKYSGWKRTDDSPTLQEKHDDRELYAAGATATTEVSRIFDIGGKRIDKIRHTIKPEVAYTYVPNIGQEGMPDYVSKIYEQNTIMYALTNTLTAKLKNKENKKSYLEFARLKLSQTYDISTAEENDMAQYEEKKHFGDIDMELDIKPSQYVSFSARNKYGVNGNGWRQTNYDLNLQDDRGDTATIGYRYTKSAFESTNPYSSISPFSSYRYTHAPLQEINLSIKALVTKSMDVVHILRKNELDHRTLESSFGLNYHKQCWSVDARYSETPTDRSYTVLFSLYGLGKNDH